MRNNTHLLVFFVTLLALFVSGSAHAGSANDRMKTNRLIQATGSGNVTLLNELLKSGGDPNTRDADGLPLLVIAASAKIEACVKTLLEAGADPNIRVTNANGEFRNAPAIQFPAANGNVAILRLFLDRGCEIEAADDTGLRPLMSAAFMGNLDTLKMLLKAGAKVDSQDGVGYTALMFAANAGKEECVRTLIENKANPNAKDAQGSTPLMFAAQHGYNSCARLLLANGAQPKTKGTHGMSAIDFARQNHLKETEAILLGK